MFHKIVVSNLGHAWGIKRCWGSNLMSFVRVIDVFIMNLFPLLNA